MSLDSGLNSSKNAISSIGSQLPSDFSLKSLYNGSIDSDLGGSSLDSIDFQVKK